MEGKDRLQFFHRHTVRHGKVTHLLCIADGRGATEVKAAFLLPVAIDTVRVYRASDWRSSDGYICHIDIDSAAVLAGNFACFGNRFVSMIVRITSVQVFVAVAPLTLMHSGFSSCGIDLFVQGSLSCTYVLYRSVEQN